MQNGNTESEHTDSIGLFLAVSAGQGDKLVFRYPRATASDKDSREHEQPAGLPATRRRSGNNSGDQASNRSHNSVYACRAALNGGDDFYPTVTSISSQQFLASVSDEDMSRLLARPGKCGKPFLLKIENVQFVGFPLSLKEDRLCDDSVNKCERSASCASRSERRTLMSGDRDDSLISFNVVFALAERTARNSAVRSAYLELAKRIAIAVKHCELRAAYLTHCSNDQLQQQLSVGSNAQSNAKEGPEALSRECNGAEDWSVSQNRLARELFSVYRQACEAGCVRVALNGSVEINWTLVEKVHALDRAVPLRPAAVLRAITRMKPFHAILLLGEGLREADTKRTLIESLPPDHSASFNRFIQAVSATRNLVRVANEADLTLGQAFEIAAQLVWFGKAFLIYPLAETNIYSVAPGANCAVNAKLTADFAAAFQSEKPSAAAMNSGTALLHILSELSVPKPICELQRDSLLRGAGRLFGDATVTQRNALLCWLLRNQLVVQLHLYIDLVPFSVGPFGHNLSRSMSQATVNANSILNVNVNSAAMDTRRSFSAHTSSNLALNIPLKPRSVYPRSSSFSISSFTPQKQLESDGTPYTARKGRTRNAESASFVQSLAAHSEADSQLTALINTSSNDSLTDEPDRTSSRCSTDTQPSLHSASKREEPQPDAEGVVLAWLREAVRTRISPERQACITQDDLRFLAYLLQRGYFFMSRFHLEEITYVENVLRHDLLVLVDKFYPLLTTCLLPDPCTSVFVNHPSGFGCDTHVRLFNS